MAFLLQRGMAWFTVALSVIRATFAGFPALLCRIRSRCVTLSVTLSVTMRDRLHRPDPSTLLAWRASQISDPIARLRYLREAAQPRRRTRRAVSPAPAFAFSILIMLTLLTLPTVSDTTTTLAHRPAPRRFTQTADVWPVESTADFETYSNGLRIENRFSVPGEPRGVIAPSRRKIPRPRTPFRSPLPPASFSTPPKVTSFLSTPPTLAASNASPPTLSNSSAAIVATIS